MSAPFFERLLIHVRAARGVQHVTKFVLARLIEDGEPFVEVSNGFFIVSHGCRADPFRNPTCTACDRTNGVQPDVSIGNEPRRCRLKRLMSGKAGRRLVPGRMCYEA